MNHDDQSLTQEIIRIVIEATRAKSVDENTTRETLSEWDSLAYMSILSEIEVEYDIEITEDNINNFDSIESIVNIIKGNS